MVKIMMQTPFPASAAQVRKLLVLFIFGCVLPACAFVAPARGQQHIIYHYSPGDWAGMHGATDTALLFQAVRSQLTRLRISNFVLQCTGPKGQFYEWPVTLSLRQTENFPFFINENGRFDGGFEVAPRDLAYGGLEVNMQGHIEGTTGTVTLWMRIAQPDGIRCDGTIRNLRVRHLSQNIPHLPEPSGPGRPAIPR
jgi:hypothetical protein